MSCTEMAIHSVFCCVRSVLSAAHVAACDSSVLTSVAVWWSVCGSSSVCPVRNGAGVTPMRPPCWWVGCPGWDGWAEAVCPPPEPLCLLFASARPGSSSAAARGPFAEVLREAVAVWALHPARPDRSCACGRWGAASCQRVGAGLGALSAER